MSEDIQAVAEEAAEQGRKTFDLKARLQKRPIRFEKVRVFTDEVTGHELGGFEDVRNGDGFVVGRRGWGAAKELADLKLLNKDGSNDDAIAAKVAEMGELVKKLDETALDFELQALPEIIKKDARRATKEALGIHGKVPADHETFPDEFSAQILQRTVVAFTDVASGHRQLGISIDEARDFYGYLPADELRKLDNAVAKLQFQATIADQATSQVDF